MFLRFAMSLLAALIVCAVSGTAFAEGYSGPLWRINGSAVTENKTIKAKSVSTLKLEDTKVGESVECKVNEEGKVGPEGKGEVTSATASECKPVKMCEASTITVKAVHVPWKTQLEEAELRNLFASGGAGAPGWDIECKVLGIKLNDECTGETTALAENVTGGVDLIYDSNTAPLTCSVGGAESGVVSGTELDENPVSGTLTVTGIPMTVKNIGGSPGVGGFNTTKCIFKETSTRCEIEYINNSTVEVKVTVKALEGIEPTTYYSYTAQGCTVGSKMVAGGKCLDKVELKVLPPAGRIIVATVRVQQVGVTSNAGFARGFLET